jgi:hypothetical protein
MARPQCDTLFVPFRKYLLGFFFLCMCRPVLGLGFGAHWMSRLSCCVSTLDCKKTWCVTPVLSLSLSLSLSQKYWSSCCEVELTPISCRWRLESQTWWCLKTSCCCNTCLIISFYRYHYVVITKVLRIIRLPCLLACCLPADVLIFFLPSCLVESLSLLFVISPVYYNPVVSIRGLHLSSNFLSCRPLQNHIL